ncbi:UDP-N-acetylmuramoyl-L-alanine--D-glutamate ligase [Oribacterium parvum]|uniref:UDP-N-acetylmuramoyl-L-alanine--D-glutamate ligase n=1 Tax=Oribacterium parvum TaxID=1501329 RepID=UPI0028E335E6|nr:UDP-N-acetylmuramoyl-L-alanine--D-glutamate ligase [Oribacterium parvum]
MNRRKVLVLGTGRSGIASAKQILAMGGEVIFFDANPKLDEKKILAQFKKKEEMKISKILKGKLFERDLLKIDAAVISPGIPLDEPYVLLLNAAKIPVIGEIELAYQSLKGKLCAVTGTNGKTTTVSLIGEILKSQYADTHVVGNIGNPFTAEALDTEEQSATVCEVSSFQLESIVDFRPHVSAITNITPDHLDRHKTMKNYIAVKESISINQTEEDSIVLNYMDPELRKFGKKRNLKPKVLWFSSEEEPKEGFFLRDDEFIYKSKDKEEKLFKTKDVQLLGKHNYENIMCSMAVALKMGVPMDKIIKVCKKFKPVEHRIEFVRERSGVRYYNDSKGTNVDAAIQALRAMPGPVVLIGGGYDKHVDFDAWVKEFKGRVKYLVLIGETRNQIAACAKKHGFHNLMFAEDMDEAVKDCAAYADPGDYVLLSPACASWGMFKDYEERGRVFKDCVKSL